MPNDLDILKTVIDRGAEEQVTQHLLTTRIVQAGGEAVAELRLTAELASAFELRMLAAALLRIADRVDRANADAQGEYDERMEREMSPWPSGMEPS